MKMLTLKMQMLKTYFIRCVVYDKSRYGFGKAMVEKKLVLLVLLLCCFNTATTSESGDYGGL